MDANEYQKLAARTLIDGPDFTLTDQEFMTLWDAIGLAGEAGEVADVVKKGILHRHGLDTAKLRKEIGDTLWYAAALCTTQGWSMSEIMQENIDKLIARYPNGFSSEDSQKRADLPADETIFCPECRANGRNVALFALRGDLLTTYRCPSCSARFTSPDNGVVSF